MYKLYHGDCLDILQNMPERSVDCILTDPPYGVDFQSCQRKKRPQFAKIANDKKPFVEWIPAAFRVLTDNGCILVFTRWDVEHIFIAALKTAGFDVKSEIIWDKKWWGSGDLTGAFAPLHENILFATKGKYTFPGARPKDVISFQRYNGCKLLHPNQKPVELLQTLVKSVCSKNSTVLDPFMGSGTTGVAAKTEGMNFTGIELDKIYFDIAEQRIEEEEYIIM